MQTHDDDDDDDDYKIVDVKKALKISCKRFYGVYWFEEKISIDLDSPVLEVVLRFVLISKHTGYWFPEDYCHHWFLCILKVVLNIMPLAVNMQMILRIFKRNVLIVSFPPHFYSLLTLANTQMHVTFLK